MVKIIFITFVVIFFLNITISFKCYIDNNNEIRLTEAELNKACAILIFSIEEYFPNHSVIKTGNYDDLEVDIDSLFLEYNVFLDHCRYLKNDEVKMKILIFDNIIYYFNKYNKVMYLEPVTQGEGICDIQNKIKRQLAKVFVIGEFRLDRKMLDNIGAKTLILISEKTLPNLGFAKTIGKYYYSKMKIN